MLSKKLKSNIRDIDKVLFSGQLKKFYLNRFSGLSSINLDIGGSCNLNCRMCTTGDIQNKKPPMEAGLLKKLGGIFREIDSVRLQCSTEPLLNKNIIEIIHYIRKENKDLFISFVTNGTLLNHQLAKELLASGLDKIAISVDAVNKDLFEKIRIGANYETVIENIKDLALQREGNRFHTRIGILGVAAKYNLGELEGILELAQELGLDFMSVNGLEPYNDELKGEVLYGEEINPEYEAVFKSLTQRAKEYGIKLELPALKLSNDNSCYLHNLIIDSQGDVYPRSSLINQMKLGNIHEKDINQIWNAEEFSNFREKIKQGQFSGYCEKCLMRRKVVCPI